MAQTVYARQGDTVDAICWRTFGVTAGVVETVYELNRGLAALGPVLPMGTPVLIPDAQDVGTRVLATLQLWD
ncbi:tail protein X [Dyella sp.]|uniref:tail protein X n=1 Tax=Dyella sp. TaxID=1869338 RepID=UPI002B486B5F|nr:tail protein X [Dyella sp.]HKT28793.1 tail protein X [Dyella sp.]